MQAHTTKTLFEAVESHPLAPSAWRLRKLARVLASLDDAEREAVDRLMASPPPIEVRYIIVSENPAVPRAPAPAPTMAFQPRGTDRRSAC